MKYDGCNLRKVLEEHKKYIDLYYNSDPKVPVPDESWKADFRGCDLRNVIFKNFVCYSDKEIELRHAMFQGATLNGCNLSNCDLSYSRFDRATIIESVFYESKLHGIRADAAIFACDQFILADLSSAIMENAKIVSCNFKSSNLDGAYLTNAKLYDEDFFLDSTNITDKTKMPFIPMKCPSEGSFIGWKVGLVIDDAFSSVPALIKLEIPKRAKRTGYLSNKCRCSEAKVLDITELHHPRKHHNQACGIVYRDFVYTVGRIARSEQPFNDSKWETCANGIHFFTSKEEAVQYAKELLGVVVKK